MATETHEMQYKRCETHVRKRKRVEENPNTGQPDIVREVPFGWQASFWMSDGSKVTITFPLDKKPEDLERWRARGIRIVLRPKLEQTTLDGIAGTIDE